MRGRLALSSHFGAMLGLATVLCARAGAATLPSQHNMVLAPTGETTCTLTDLRPFSLVIDQAYRTDIIPGDALARGYHSNWFARTMSGFHLASMTRHPEPWRRVKPAAMLRLDKPVLLSAQSFRMEMRLLVGKAPDHVNLDIARFRTNATHTPLALFVQGDTVRLRHCLTRKKCKTIIAGTLAQGREAHIIMDARPGGALNVRVNGTPNVIPLSSFKSGQQLFFETGVGSDNDVNEDYAPESAELLSLTIHS